MADSGVDVELAVSKLQRKKNLGMADHISRLTGLASRAKRISLSSIPDWADRAFKHIPFPAAGSPRSNGSKRWSLPPRPLLLVLLLMQLVILAVIRSSYPLSWRIQHAGSPHHEPILRRVSSDHAVKISNEVSVDAVPVKEVEFVQLAHEFKENNDALPEISSFEEVATLKSDEPDANVVESDKNSDSDASEQRSEDKADVETELKSEDNSAATELGIVESEENDEREASEAKKSIVEEEDTSLCKGINIFVYDLPQELNADLVANCSTMNPWVSMCPAFENEGLGQIMENSAWPTAKEAWFASQHYAGEPHFHSRMKKHPCTTNDPESANAFYIPFYAGIDVMRFLWVQSTAEERDILSKKLLEWLDGQKYWARNGGADHFLMVSGITWDFKRSHDGGYGTKFLHMPQTKNLTILVVERDPWDGRELGIPYLTGFHPRNENDLQEWQEFVRGSKREHLFSYAGAAKEGIENDFRTLIADQCVTSGSCNYMNCSNCEEDLAPLMDHFLSSKFCLHPRGDIYTKRSMFDSLVAGCIPVFFWRQSFYLQYDHFLPSEGSSYSVFIDKQEVRDGKNIRDFLQEIPEETVKSMQEEVISMIPKLVYATGELGDDTKDAFDIAIDAVLRKLKKKLHHQWSQAK